MLERAASASTGRLRLLRVDVDAVPPQQLEQLRVASVPAILVMHGGRFLPERMDGPPPSEAALTSFLQRAKALGGGPPAAAAGGDVDKQLAQGCALSRHA